MPEATPFQTLGVGNGFPFCFEKVDVSGYDHWTTFGGFNKNSVGNPTDAQIYDSRAAAMKLYWNLYRVELTATDSLNSDYDISEVIINNEEWVDGDGAHADAVEPKGRVCQGTLSAKIYAGTIAQVDFRSSAIIRMYNGATTNENNFIGYGGGEVDFNSDHSNIYCYAYDGVAGDAFSALGGYGDEFSTSGWDESYAYEQVDGVHFLWVGIASQIGSPFTQTLNSSTRLAQINDASSPYLTASIDTLEFYTYP